MGKINWTDHVRNEEVLRRVNEQRNILHEIRKRKAKWIGHILRRNCLLKQFIERKIKGEMEVTRRRGRSISGTSQFPNPPIIIGVSNVAHASRNVYDNRNVRSVLAREPTSAPREIT